MNEQPRATRRDLMGADSVPATTRPRPLFPAMLHVDQPIAFAHVMACTPTGAKPSRSCDASLRLQRA